MSSRKIELRAGESVSFDGPAKVTLLEKSGRVARLDVQAETTVKITQSSLSASSMARGGLTVGKMLA